MTATSPNKSDSVQRVVAWLNAQVGTVEKGGQNCVKYWGMSTKPEWNCIGNWCQAFVQVALSENGHSYIPCSGDLYYLVSAAVYTAKQKGTWIPVEDRIGKVDPAKPNTMYAVVYGFVGGSQYQHIGWMVDWWDSAGNYVQTIEGNTSSGSSGSQNNGEGVYERHRPISNGYIQINGFIEYTFTPSEEDMEPREVWNTDEIIPSPLGKNDPDGNTHWWPSKYLRDTYLVTRKIEAAIKAQTDIITAQNETIKALLQGQDVWVDVEAIAARLEAALQEATSNIEVTLKSVPSETP